MKEQLNTALTTYWKENKFEDLTPIQRAMFEPMMNKESFIAISPTGTGKTLAYLIPLLQQIEANQSLQVIILAPSQELVKQIGEVAEEWGKVVGIRTQTILGGANVSRQIEALKDKPELIVATPGRLVELLGQTRKLKVHLVETIVYDEADYLWLEEHHADLDQIEKRLDNQVQKVWVSATYGAALQNISREDEAVRLIELTEKDTSLPIDHLYVITSDRQKINQLRRLAQVSNMQAIVFFEQVNQLEEAASKLLFEGIPVAALHSQLSNLERRQAIEAFKAGKLIYLLTTDVASRGIDVKALPYAIHFNRVRDLELYSHRSGRVGRMGHHGHVISLVNEQEHRDLQQLLAARSIKLQERVVYQAQLLTPEEKAELTPENETNETEKVKNKKPAKQVNPERGARSTRQTKVKKHKNRTNKQKNKGKRRTRD